MLDSDTGLGWALGIDGDDGDKFKIAMNPETPHFTIQPDGKIGIGTASPSRMLDVNGTDPRIRFSPTGGREAWTIGPSSVGWSLYNEDDATTRFVVTETGRFGIATLSPASALEVNGCITGSFCSDAAFKSEIRDLDEPVLDRIARLQAKTYVWKSDKRRKRRIGLVAQDVERVFPEVVTSATDGSQKGLSCTGLNGIAIAAIKEQQAEIEELKTALETKRGEVDELRRRLDRMEAKLK